MEPLPKINSLPKIAIVKSIPMELTISNTARTGFVGL